MATYTIDTPATIWALEAAGMDSRQAEVVVAAISRSDAELATKSDLKAEIAELKAEVFRAFWIQAADILEEALTEVEEAGQAQHYVKRPRKCVGW